MVTKLEHARALKQMKIPLNTPVEQRTFSAEYTRNWVHLMAAHREFTQAVTQYTTGTRAGSPGKWKLMRCKLIALDRAFSRCGVLLGKLGGDVLPPEFRTEQDEHEHAILGHFLTEHAAPFIQFWKDGIDAVDAGASLTIKPSDIPPWP
ncbi:hypothetical protein [Bradyrhizobium sp. STM 3566]|uniref:hypothetical protein n=1 Tax=Bradyrhizobium sp. STM 3566 TaxID=578928 RepID=UPI0038900877